MRVYTRRVFQLTLAVFLLGVLYLNLYVGNLSEPTWRRNVHDANQRPHLLFNGSPFHNHSVARISVPAPDPDLDVYPSLARYDDDRIVKQLAFTAPALEKEKQSGLAVKKKLIFAHGGVGGWSVQGGTHRFQEDNCLVQDCELIDDAVRLNEADVVLFKHMPYDPKTIGRPLGQIWMLFLLESPYHTPSFSALTHVFNWTSTYRHDSSLVAPYEKFVAINSSLLTRQPIQNYAKGKTKKVAWFVSNCGARNQRRLYAEQLGQHIQVDVYGGCGTLHCPRSQPDHCFGMLNTDYKFYLAFENSNCRDYITEKFFINGLKHDVIPIVMGAAPEDYRRAAPPHSFIHVDDFESPKALAEYLHQLDQNDELYNQYFAWKGLWDNINTFFWCRLCHLAHDVERRGPMWYEDVESWWRGPGVCIGQENWRQFKRDPSGLIAPLAVRGHQ